MSVGDWVGVVGAFIGVLTVMFGVFKYIMTAIHAAEVKNQLAVAELRRGQLRFSAERAAEYPTE